MLRIKGVVRDVFDVPSEVYCDVVRGRLNRANVARHGDLHRYLHPPLVAYSGDQFIIRVCTTWHIAISRRDARRNGESQTVDFGIVLQLDQVFDLNLDRLACRDVPKTRADTSGVCCSSRPAVSPRSTASLYSTFACSFSFTIPSMIRSPM